MTQAKIKQVDTHTHAPDIEAHVSSGDADHEEDHDHGHALSWPEISRVLFVAAAAGAIWFFGATTNLYITVIGVICTFVGGFPIFHEAWENIVQRRMTMELSMTIAIV